MNDSEKGAFVVVPAFTSPPAWLRLMGFLLAAGLLSALIIVIARGNGAPLEADAVVHAWVLTHRHRFLTSVAVVITTTGSGPIAYALAALAAILGAARERWWQAIAAAVLALAGGQLIRIALALWIARTRPPVADWAWHASGPALPSGHTTTAALVAALFCIARARRPTAVATAAAALAVLWAASVGLTRIYLGVHWPSDVAAGWLLAAVLSLGIYTLLTPNHSTSGTAGPPARPAAAPTSLG